MGGTVAEVEIPADEFALHETLAAFGDVVFEIERLVAHDMDRVMPFVWASGADGDELTAALDADPSVENLRRLVDGDGEQLYQMEWIDRIQTLVHMLVQEEATVLAAVGRGDVWRFRVLFPRHSALSETYEYCEENGFALEFTKIYRMDDGSGREGGLGLTRMQQETLTAALERGYYGVPREVTTAELADEMGISHQALSERLRRGHEALIENALMTGRDGDDGN
ncbi:bacterio-opsin activator domain-containing protein [Halomarina halobia]|uniref:Bacterio-opsin activator domain-containing protein n=1 Tax=Halomarina halobia TaxID=3033386 RepID=A0ABD6A4U8_9EURY|nr:bacterio-opsin activator domain-containing protein [Halomarina sp. PSR21]